MIPVLKGSMPFFLLIPLISDFANWNLFLKTPKIDRVIETESGDASNEANGQVALAARQKLSPHLKPPVSWYFGLIFSAETHQLSHAELKNFDWKPDIIEALDVASRVCPTYE